MTQIQKLKNYIQSLPDEIDDPGQVIYDLIEMISKLPDESAEDEKEKEIANLKGYAEYVKRIAAKGEFPMSYEAYKQHHNQKTKRMKEGITEKLLKVENKYLAAWVVSFYDILTELTELKKIKDEQGKTDDYLKRQPIAWEKANGQLKSFDDKRVFKNCEAFKAIAEIWSTENQSNNAK